MPGMRTKLWGAGAFAAVLLGVAACGGGGGGGDGAFATLANCEENPNTCNSAQNPVTEGKQRITWALSKNIQSWNLNSASGHTAEYGQALSGVFPNVWTVAPDLSVKLNKDLMVSVEKVEDRPQTIVYEIQPDAQWMDGTPITARDFRYVWKTLNGRDCPECEAASTSGYRLIESVEGSDGGKTVTVTYRKPYTDWKSMFSDPIYPAHIAAKHGNLDTPQGLAKSFEWFNTHVPTFSGGPFKVQNWVDNKALTLVPNQNWYGKGPYLDRLVFRIITEASQQVPALANNEVQAIYPQPQLDLVQRVKSIPRVSQNIAFGFVWEHFDFNLGNKYLQDEALRDAMFTAVDRQQILDKTLGQFTDKAQVKNSHTLVPGQEHYRDVVPDAHGSGNVARAKQILTKAGYTIRNQGGNPTLITPDGVPLPTLDIYYTAGNQRRQTQVTLFKQMVAPLGVDMRIRPTNDLGGTLTEGNYDVITFAWVGGPFPFLGGVQLYSCDFSETPPEPNGGNYGNYCNKKVSQLFKEAAYSTNREKAFRKLNKADAMLSDDAYSLPLFQLPTFLAVYDRYGNIRSNPTNFYPTYNVGRWAVESGGQ